VRQQISPRAVGSVDGAVLAIRETEMTVLPRDSEIIAVVVILGTVLITGLLRAF
jgi:hypothetical protein